MKLEQHETINDAQPTPKLAVLQHDLAQLHELVEVLMRHNDPSDIAAACEMNHSDGLNYAELRELVQSSTPPSDLFDKD